MSSKACAVVGLLWLSSLAVGARAEGRSPKAVPSRARAPLSYAGVSPEAGDPPPQVRPAGDVQLITWPGFRARPGQGQEVFLQLTGTVPFTSRVRGRRVEVSLSKVDVALHNNLRRVLTKQFGGAVSSFKLYAQKGHRVRLEIRLARPLRPTITTEQRGAYTFLRIAFPAL
ncbi:MAG: hypothetical protein IPL40_05955 [Proteobacteria bacterium]|nr:hypothetical protein [Pseudomonadota bacterium]